MGSVFTHTHALHELSCLFEFYMIRKIICAIWNLNSHLYLCFIFYALWLSYQLIIHACSDTDLRKFDLCKFSSVFLVFQCGASGLSTLTSKRIGGPDGTLLESGRGWSPHVRTGPDGVWTCAVIIVRTVSLYRSDARDQSAPFRGSERPDIINPPSRRGPHKGYKNPCSWHSLPTPTKSLFLAVCELCWL
jgi:hypothetical protein